MKQSKILLCALALPTVLAVAACSPKKAEAAPLATLGANTYVSAAYGHQWAPDNKEQRTELGVSQRDRGFPHFAVGTEFANGVKAQVEYSQAKPTMNGSSYHRGKQETYAVVANVPVWSPVNSVNTYGVAGLGFTQISTRDHGKNDSAVVTLGAGAEWVANPTVSVFAEGRAQYVDKGEYWQPQALLGVRVNTYQVYKNATGASYR